MQRMFFGELKIAMYNCNVILDQSLLMEKPSLIAYVKMIFHFHFVVCGACHATAFE